MGGAGKGTLQCEKTESPGNGHLKFVGLGFGGLEVWRFGGLEVWRFGGLEVWRFRGLEV